jgi:hypothetical protein
MGPWVGSKTGGQLFGANADAGDPMLVIGNEHVEGVTGPVDEHSGLDLQEVGGRDGRQAGTGSVAAGDRARRTGVDRGHMTGKTAAAGGKGHKQGDPRPWLAVPVGVVVLAVDVVVLNARRTRGVISGFGVPGCAEFRAM